MLGGAKVYTFRFIRIDDTITYKDFVAPSKQMAWIMAAGYVTCHTLNPSVVGIGLIRERAVDGADGIGPLDAVSVKEAINIIHNL